MPTMKTQWILILCLILSSCVAVESQALEVHGYSTLDVNVAKAKYERFYQPTSGGDPPKQFIGQAYDWSGVGRWHDSGGTWQKWAIMISDTHFLSAAHTGDKVGTEFQFVRGNNLQSGAQDVWTGTVVEEVARIGDQVNNYVHDLQIGRFAEAPPSWVKRYPLMKRPETFNYLGVVDSTVLIAGRSSPASTFVNGESAFSMRMGRNQLAFPIDNQIWWRFDTDSNGLGADEAQNESGDSGGPTFVITPAGLALAGIHASGTSDHSISANLTSIIANMPEDVSEITDLSGDSDADFDVDGDDLNVLLSNFNSSGRDISDGDATGDGVVSSDDLNLVLINFGRTLRSPADFNNDWHVDASDFGAIGDNWHQTVPSGQDGDANGDEFVDADDINKLNETWDFSQFSLPTPPLDLDGDFNSDGLVNMNVDYAYYLGPNFGQTVTAFEDGDMDGDSDVDSSDLNQFLLSLRPAGVADLDSDGKVMNSDLELLIANLGMTSPAMEDGDLNLDDQVNSLDFAIMGSYWGLGVSVHADLPLDPIPEPSTGIIAAVALLGLPAAHRRN